MSTSLTAEQAAAVEAFRAGGDLCVQAGAGTGKTFTLREMASSAPNERMIYLAFNRAIVDEARVKMPRNVTPTTAHSLAMKAVGRRYSHRLPGQGSKRMRGDEMARILGLDPFVVTFGRESKRLAPGWLASLVMRGIERFCQTADPVPGFVHVPWSDGLAESQDSPEAKAANRELARYLEPFLARAWADLTAIDGRLPFAHSHYLKMYQLTSPALAADRLLVDEAQDLNPCMDAIVNAQWDMGRVWVGDSNQQIYGWNGAIDAMDRPGVPTVMLSQSFRFGTAIADAANVMLSRLPTVLRLTGTPAIKSQLGPLDRPDAILTRSNGGAISEFIAALSDGLRPAMVGGAKEIVAFARGARSLQVDGWSSHSDLACFGSWGEVVTYVQDDPAGSDLAMLVRIMEEHGPSRVIEVLDNQPSEDVADVVISTAHKSKGREWRTVRLGDDFPPKEAKKKEDDQAPSPEEVRLLYVAVTRAMETLDPGDHPWLTTTQEKAV